MYVIEYYLPNQSHLFSEPQRAGCTSKKDLAKKVAIAEAHGYDLIGVYEVCGTYFNPIADGYEDIKAILAITEED